MSNKLVKKSNILFFGDVHFPHHDSKALELLLRVVAEEKWSYIYCMGDLLDLAQCSKYLQDKRMDTLQQEINLAVGFLSELRKEAGRDTQIFFKEGNHDVRIWKKLLSSDSMLQGLECLTIPALLKLQEQNITFIPYTQRHELGNIIITHDWYSQPKKNLLEAGSGWNGVSGHHHRLSKTLDTNYSGDVRYWVETGYLGSRDPKFFEYNGNKPIKWQSGFAAGNLFYYENGVSTSNVDPVTIGKEYDCTVFGKYYQIEV